METSDFYGTEKVSRILLKIAPPVMLAQLIQALYNIPSLTVGKIKMATNPVNMGSVAVFYFVTICAIL